MSEEMGYKEAREYLQNMRIFFAKTIDPKLTKALLLADEALLSKIAENEGEKKLLKEKDDKLKPDVKPNIEEMIKEIEELPDTIYSGSIMDVTGVSCKDMKEKVIEIIRKYSK